MRLRAIVVATLLAACAPAVEDDVTDQASDELGDEKGDRVMAPSAPVFYRVERDTRRCAAPGCGGWYVARVGRATTTCADGTAADRCYVMELDLAAVGLSDEEERAATADAATLILRGKVQTRSVEAGRFGVLAVDEAFRAATPVAATPTLYQLSDRGVRCIAAACFSMIAEKLNSTVNVTLSGLGGSLAPRVSDELALGPVLVTGPWRTVADGGRVLEPTSLWTRVEAADPARCEVDIDCEATGYSRPVASASDCYCPTCADAVVNRATAESNRRSWELSCSNVRLACSGATCTAPRAVACQASRCAVVE